MVSDISPYHHHHYRQREITSPFVNETEDYVIKNDLEYDRWNITVEIAVHVWRRIVVINFLP